MKSATIIARRSKQSDRNESGYGTPLRRRAPPAKRRGARPRLARQAVVDAVRATADTLNASLEQMKVVEGMRRTLREIRDVNNLDSN